MIVEVCANSFESAKNAQLAGAQRIELCAELGVGGVTPSYGLLKKVMDELNIAVNVLIRPRSGDFTYSDAEIDIMKQNIELCADLGCNGVVAGVLHKNFTLNVEKTQELIDASGDMMFTFHRAFDWVKDPKATFLQLQEMGVDAILTSGQQKSAPDGFVLLSELNKLSTTCKIMPGGGVRTTNVDAFIEEGFSALHMSGAKFHQTLDVKPPFSMNSLSFLQEDQIAISEMETIKSVVKSVK